MDIMEEILKIKIQLFYQLYFGKRPDTAFYKINLCLISCQISLEKKHNNMVKAEIHTEFL